MGSAKGVRRATRFLVTMNNFHIIKIMSIIDPFQIDII